MMLDRMTTVSKECREWYNNLSREEKDKVTDEILRINLKGNGIAMYLEDLHKASSSIDNN